MLGQLGDCPVALHGGGCRPEAPVDLGSAGSFTFFCPSQVLPERWILQIAGALTEASAKNVILTGGAQAENVFWATAGAVSIGTQAHFEGFLSPLLC